MFLLSVSSYCVRYDDTVADGSSQVLDTNERKENMFINMMHVILLKLIYNKL